VGVVSVRVVSGSFSFFQRARAVGVNCSKLPCVGGSLKYVSANQNDSCSSVASKYQRLCLWSKATFFFSR
jgi:hypothetical protein